jgi:hypothetical protein
MQYINFIVIPEQIKIYLLIIVPVILNLPVVGFDFFFVWILRIAPGPTSFSGQLW